MPQIPWSRNAKFECCILCGSSNWRVITIFQGVGSPGAIQKDPGSDFHSRSSWVALGLCATPKEGDLEDVFPAGTSWLGCPKRHFPCHLSPPTWRIIPFSK